MGAGAGGMMGGGMGQGTGMGSEDQNIKVSNVQANAAGTQITEVWGACLRDEHGVENLTTVKVAVNPAQVAEYGLSPLPVKDGSSRKSKFVKAHGSNVYELEALEPDQLQSIIRGAIREVLDMNLFAAEQRAESEEARYVVAYQERVAEALRQCQIGGGGE